MPAAACLACVLGTVGAQTGGEQASPPAERPRPADASALFARLAAVRGLEAAFEEQKHLALLALPLASKGRLYFHRPEPGGPAWLTRLVDSPEPASVRITPRELRLENRDGVEVVDLQKSDKVRTFVVSLVHVFAGDEAALRRSYDVAYEPDPEDGAAWTLALEPRVEPLDKLLRELRLAGRGEAVQRIEVHEPNGDRTITHIVRADPERVFDAAERQRLFGIGER